MSEAERLANQALNAIIQELTSLADEVRRDSVPTNQSVGAPRLVLKASFLVDNRAGETFRSRAAELARTFSPGGLRVDLSGPWAPYSFVGKPLT